MIGKALLLAIVGLLTVGSPSLAQQGGGGADYYGFTFQQPQHRFEIIPYYGYAWTVSRGANFGAPVGSGDVDIKSSDMWGVMVDINAKPGAQVRLLYQRQDSDLTFKQAGVTTKIGDVGVEYWQIGGVGGLMNDQNIMPFSMLTLGATRYILSDMDPLFSPVPNPDDVWKFSIILGLGAKFYLSERVGLLVSGRMPFTFTSGFLGIGTGGLSVGGTGNVQFDVSAGLMINI